MTKSITEMTLRERQDLQLGMDALRQIEYDIHKRLSDTETIPREWHEICDITDHRDIKTTRVTIRLDADVVKFFRALGPGYQPRINRVLRAFMEMRLAKIVQGPDTTDYILNPERLEARMQRKRPDCGQQFEYARGAELRLDESMSEFIRRKVEHVREEYEEKLEAYKRGEGDG